MVQSKRAAEFVATVSGGTGNVTQLLVPQASGNDRARSVAFDPIGDLVIGIELGGTVDLGAGPVTAPDGARCIALFPYALEKGEEVVADDAMKDGGLCARGS